MAECWLQAHEITFFDREPLFDNSKGFFAIMLAYMCTRKDIPLFSSSH